MEIDGCVLHFMFFFICSFYFSSYLLAWHQACWSGRAWACMGAVLTFACMACRVPIRDNHHALATPLPRHTNPRMVASPSLIPLIVCLAAQLPTVLGSLCWPCQQCAPATCTVLAKPSRVWPFSARPFLARRGRRGECESTRRRGCNARIIG